eukprot:TRINITY_DN23862_c0_g1_i3.p1 TRINITY_DN23862_c0_g1~~TRINITY_DN23862_c0_g1_i3.p1  ORF type:complete len:326 (-),score=34.27 TRINITY_DN23862_c0_g1_i3:55-1032(-)
MSTDLSCESRQLRFRARASSLCTHVSYGNVVIFPKRLMAFSHKVAGRKLRVDGGAWLAVEDIWDLERMSQESNGLYRAVAWARQPLALRELQRTAPMRGFESFLEGAPCRQLRDWTDEDTTAFFQRYRGVLLTIPYFFCDRKADFASSNAERILANSAFRWSPLVQNLIAKVIWGLTRSAHKSIVSLHLQEESVYNVRPTMQLKSDLERLQPLIDPTTHSFYVAAGVVSNATMRMLASLGYEVFTKHDFLPRGWVRPEFFPHLPYLAAAVDFGVTEWTPLHIGPSWSSFDRMLAAVRLAFSPELLTVGFEAGAICPDQCLCGWYC